MIVIAIGLIGAFIVCNILAKLDGLDNLKDSEND